MKENRLFIRTSRGDGIGARASGRARQRGYTLIEIIVAFAILALGLTLLLGTLSGATRQVRAAGDAGRAGLHAQSLLDEFGNLPQPQQREGELQANQEFSVVHGASSACRSHGRPGRTARQRQRQPGDGAQ